MEKTPTDDNLSETDLIFAEFVREAEKAAPAIPVAKPAFVSRYRGPPKLTLIQGGLTTPRS